MQFIPRLSSTSINNKHLHESRAGLGGFRRHRPARSTSDETPCLLGPCRAPHLLSTRLVFRFPNPQAQSLLMPSRTYQSCSFIMSDRDPSVPTLVAESTCGSWQETEALVQDSAASLACPGSFRQPDSVIDVARRFCDRTGCRVRVMRELQRESKCVFLHINVVFEVNRCF